MAEIADDDILEMASDLARREDLTDDQRDAVVLAVQRMLWPPSPHFFLHEGEHIGLSILRRETGGGWQGRLACPSGCGRAWNVYQARTEDAVYQALQAAHQEYRSGKATSEYRPTRTEHRLALDDVLGRRTEYVEVHDQRLTPEEVTG